MASAPVHVRTSGPCATQRPDAPLAVVPHPHERDAHVVGAGLAGALERVVDDAGEDRRVTGHDDVVLDQVLIAPHELALGVAGDVGVAVADVAARRGEAEARMVQRAQGVGVAGDERGRAPPRRFEDLRRSRAARPAEFTAWRFL